MGAKSTLEVVINGTTKGAEAAFGKVTKAIGTLGKIAIGAGVAGIAALGAGLAYSVKEAMAAEEIQSQLAAVLKSTGGAAGVTADMANDLAESLSQVTRFEDDTIVSGENILLTFTKIGKDIFPQATEAMLDMSTALGQDLQSSAIQLGKALNDPVQGMTALRRVGVSFTDAQVEMVKKMVETGDLMGAQTFILQELQTEFGGSAKAAGETFAGQLDILKNSLGNAAEGIGMALLPALTNLVSGISPIINEYAPVLADWMGKMLPIAIQTLSDYWTNTLQPAIKQVWGWMSTVLIPFLQTVVFPWLKDNIPKAIQILSDFWTNVLKPAILAVWNWMSTVLMPFLQNTVFPWLKTHIPAAIQVLSNFWTNILKPAIQAVWNWMSTVLIPFLQNTVYPWLKENIPAAIQVLSDFWNNILLPAIKAVWDFIDKYLMPIFETVKEIVEILLPIAITALQGAWENVLLPALQAVWEFVETYITPALTWLMDKVIKPLTTALGTGLKRALDLINNALKYLKDLLDKIKLPDWLTPGSPTPLELGIRGITDALHELNLSALPVFSSQLAGVGSMTGNRSNITNYYLTAQYGYQSPNSLAQDVRLLELLHT